jgi:hypothetical protein
MRTDGLADMADITAAFQNFAKAPNNIKMDRKRLGYNCVDLSFGAG